MDYLGDVTVNSNYFTFSLTGEDAHIKVIEQLLERGEKAGSEGSYLLHKKGLSDKEIELISQAASLFMTMKAMSALLDTSPSGHFNKIAASASKSAKVMGLAVRDDQISDICCQVMVSTMYLLSQLVSVPELVEELTKLNRSKGFGS